MLCIGLCRDAVSVREIVIKLISVHLLSVFANCCHSSLISDSLFTLARCPSVRPSVCELYPNG